MIDIGKPSVLAGFNASGYELRKLEVPGARATVA
jgi:hypothetical protein